MFEWTFLLLSVVLASGAALLLRRVRPKWPIVGQSALGAIIVPDPALALCAYAFFGAANTPAEKCGVDACGMIMMSAMVVGAIAVIIYLVSWAAAALLLWSLRSR